MGQYGTLFGGPGAAGGGASTAGASANTTPAITNAAGKLEAWNPQTMSGITPDKAPVQHTDFQTAGMDAGTGLPSYMTNWLSGGAVGPPPTLTQPGSTAAPVTQGAAEKGAAYVDKRKPGTGPPPVTTTPTAKPGATPAATTSGIQPINMNWVNDPSNLAVADVYNPSQGGSAPGVVQKAGSYNPIQAFIQPNGMMPQFYSDGKGGYFSDAAGLKPLDKYTTDYMKFHGIK